MNSKEPLDPIPTTIQVTIEATVTITRRQRIRKVIDIPLQSIADAEGYDNYTQLLHESSYSRDDIENFINDEMSEGLLEGNFQVVGEDPDYTDYDITDGIDLIECPNLPESVDICEDCEEDGDEDEN